METFKAMATKIDGLCSQLQVMQHLYDRLLKPILEGAVRKGLMSSIPPVDAILETAHVLPGKMDTKPIIARFFTRNIRSLVFRLKKEFAPMEQPAGKTDQAWDSEAKVSHL